MELNTTENIKTNEWETRGQKTQTENWMKENEHFTSIKAAEWELRSTNVFGFVDLSNDETISSSNATNKLRWL